MMDVKILYIEEKYNMEKYYVQWYPIENRIGLTSENKSFEEFKAQVDVTDRERKSVIVPFYNKDNFTELRGNEQIKRIVNITANNVSEVTAIFEHDTQDFRGVRENVINRIYLGGRLSLNGITESGKHFTWDISSPIPFVYKMEYKDAEDK
jgi:hypothetical protein